MIPEAFVRLAETLAQTARETARETARRAATDPEVEIKSDGSPVTTMDRAVEAALRRVIGQRQPAHGILGEEYRDRVWVIDLVDGTRQFAAGLPNFGTLVALCHRGVNEMKRLLPVSLPYF